MSKSKAPKIDIAALQKIQIELQAAVAELQGINKEETKVTTTLAKYDSQRQENETVKKELGMIAEGDKVFKLIGPALVPQDTAEAIANVNTRLEFIGAEMTRQAKVAADLAKKKDEVIGKCQALQQTMQQAQAIMQKQQEDAAKEAGGGGGAKEKK